MLATTQLQGADLLDRVLDAATARARDVLGARVALHRCQDVELRAELDAIVFRASCVSRTDEGTVIAVFATGRDRAGHDCMVAAGRFTFATFPRPSASIAARLTQWTPGIQ
ncbi:hypothetical protein RN629_11690 [Sphingomonadaceae bacterium jetA1]|jgi:hypothetical protein|uniref:hypothetical protein n=1 Tax=Facivitalis istanbulensis TaxID=3075838 RepID=UPI0034872379